jgi:hypothetical protein
VAVSGKIERGDGHSINHADGGQPILGIRSQPPLQIALEDQRSVTADRSDDAMRALSTNT